MTHSDSGQRRPRHPLTFAPRLVAFTLVAFTLMVASLGCGEREAPPVDEPALACEGDEGEGAVITIAPYVQLVGPTSAWILWETEGGLGSRVDFGPDEQLTEGACGTVRAPLDDADPATSATVVHEVELTGLEPGSTVYYRARTGDTTSAVSHLRAAPDPADEASFRLIAMSDSQRDDRHPEKFAEVVREGIIAHLEDTVGPDLAETLAFVVMPGDLVDNGWIADEWSEELFGPAAPLLSQVPLYPVPGNHEGGSPLFFHYFHLPDDGVDEHYYSLDYSNLRLIGLDSNAPYDGAEQLLWLDEVLAETCDDATIDFVFAQLHHPALSELWTPGESDWSALVVEALERFSSDCGKPSIHFFGHTHGYSRGQSRDHQHLWINVASAGGALDRWGEHPQEDYPEFVASEDTYGFVEVEVEAGDDPSFLIRRVSLGHPEDPLRNVVTDTLTVRPGSLAPATPTGTPTVVGCDGPPTLVASAFSDPDGDAHQGSHWQLAATCEGFDAPLWERWTQRKNQWMGVDLQADDDLCDELLTGLEPGESGCWRVRYRDDALTWSAWSAGVEVEAPECP